MAQTFTRPIPGAIHPGSVRYDDYTRPLTPFPRSAVRPAPAGWDQPLLPAPAAPVNRMSAPTVWGGPNARPVPPPAPWGMPPAQQGRSGRGWAWIVGGGAAALAVTIGVIAAVNSTHHGVAAPTPRASSSSSAPSPTEVPPPPTMVEDRELPRMVPSEAHAAEVAGAGSLEANTKASGPVLLSDYTDPIGCAGALVPATKSDYSGSGVRATYVQALHDTDRHNLHFVVNAVSTFDSGSQATLFATTQAVAWQGCQRTPIVMDANEGQATHWTVSDVTQQGDMLTGRTFVLDTGAHCQRALTTKLNVVVDVQVCTATVNDAAATLAKEIAGHVG